MGLEAIDTALKNATGRVDALALASRNADLAVTVAT
jgi:hypothetical protein